jgi:hypothetical protein
MAWSATECHSRSRPGVGLHRAESPETAAGAGLDVCAGDDLSAPDDDLSGPDEFGVGVDRFQRRCSMYSPPDALARGDPFGHGGAGPRDSPRG